ncbi:MAG: glycosyltransferase family 4 protein, partial [Fibrobacterota bacterium]
MSGRRVLWINWRDLRNPLAGGAEVHADEVMKRLAKKGWEIVLVSHAVPGLASREEENGYVVRREGGQSTFNFTVYSRLKRWIREEKPDLVVDDSNKI